MSQHTMLEMIHFDLHFDIWKKYDPDCITDLFLSETMEGHQAQVWKLNGIF